MSSYKHLSGNAKRKLKESRDRLEKKMKNSLSAYVIKTKEVDVIPSQILDKNQDSLTENVAEVNCDLLLETELVAESQSNNEHLVENYDEFSPDIARWPETITTAMQDYFIKIKPSPVFGDLNSSKLECVEGTRQINRSLNISAFTRINKNGEKFQRDWFVYTQTNQKAYCYVCKLFSRKKSNMTQGTCDWKNIMQKLSEHENSSEHMSSIRSLVSRSKEVGRVDSSLIRNIDSERQYWREVLKRVVATIKFLASNALAFRGKNQKFNKEDSGNYIGALKFLSEFDPFLRTHIDKHANLGTGHTNYLSSTICDEFIKLMGDRIRQDIIKEIIEAKFFSLIIDSTPDISHIDQLTVVIRYIFRSVVHERFLSFIPIHSHSGKNLENVILNYLENLGIDIKNCRGQGYDNASNMSGRYNGLQNLIKQHSASAEFIPCASHSLNLIGVAAAESSLEITEFFNTIQQLYVFFSASTSRWNVLEKLFKNKHLSVKPLSNTRWSARADAIKALSENFLQYKEALQIFASDLLQKSIVRVEAAGILHKMCEFEFVLLMYIWDTILFRINAVSRSLQTNSGSLSTAITLFTSLAEFIQKQRNNFDEFEAKAAKIAPKEYKNEKNRKRNRKLFFDENLNNNVVLEGREYFKVNTFYILCDKLIFDINRRSNVYKNIYNKFTLMFDYSEQNFKDEIKHISDTYGDDVNIQELEGELQHFNLIAKSENLNSANEKLEFLHNQKIVSSFPNVEIILRLYLTLPISNAEGERSFSVLKIIKNYLRSTIRGEKLNDLAILYIEKDKLNIINYEDMINEFTESKIRKRV